MRSDVALFHELTHAMHAAHGNMASGFVKHGPQADISGKVEDREHQAVGLEDYAQLAVSENAYRNQRNMIGHHQGGIASSNPALDDETMPQRNQYSHTF